MEGRGIILRLLVLTGLLLCLAAPGARAKKRPDPLAKRIQALVDRMSVTDIPEEREELASELADIGKPAVPKLAEVLELDRSWVVRRRVAEILCGIRSMSAERALVECFEDRDRRVRRRCAECLGERRSRYAVDALLDDVSDRDEDIEVKNSAILSLGMIGDKKATPALIELIKSPYMDALHSAAVMALGDLRDRRATLHLSELLKAPYVSPQLRRDVLMALESLGDPRAVPDLIGMLDSDDLELRMDAAMVLGGFRDKRIPPALLCALADGESAVRTRAAQSLAKAGRPSILKKMQAALDAENDEEVADNIRQAMAEIRSRYGMRKIGAKRPKAD